MNKQKGHQMPKWLLILCVAAPVVGLVTWLLIPGSSSSIVKLLPYALFMLCPLSHFLMMPLMHRTGDHHHGENPVDENRTKNKPSCH